MAKSVNKMSGKASTASKARNLNRKPARTSKANVSAMKKMTKAMKGATSKVQQANKKSGPRKMVAKTVGQRKRGPKPAGPKKMMTKTAPLSRLLGATYE